MLIHNNENIDYSIETTKQYYQQVFKYNIDNINIYASTDFEENVPLFTNEIYKDNNANGLYIEPNDIISDPIILIRASLFSQNGCPSIATILHELTHVIDYDQFIQEYCNSNWAFLRKHSLFKIMYYWSEYHARITEIVHMRILLSMIHPDYIFDVNDVAQEMIKYQLPRYNTELIDNIEADNLTLVQIFNYCARFYTCKLFSPELSIKDNVPKQMYEYFPDIEDLYDDLESMQTYENASKKFRNMNFLLHNFLYCFLCYV